MIHLKVYPLRTKTIEKHLMNKDLATYAVHYLISLPEIVFSKRLLINLVWILNVVPRAQLAVYSFIQKKDNVNFFMKIENPDWASSEIPNKLILQFIMTICIHSTDVVGNSQRIFTVLSRISLEASKKEILALFAIATATGSQSQNIELMTTTGFLNNLIKKALSIQAHNILDNLMILIDKLAQISYSEAYIQIIQYLPTFLRSNLLFRALLLAVVFSGYPQMRLPLYEQEVVQTIVDMNFPDELQEYKQKFLEQISQESE